VVTGKHLPLALAAKKRHCGPGKLKYKEPKVAKKLSDMA
jgi:hypothetical protein